MRVMRRALSTSSVALNRAGDMIEASAMPQYSGVRESQIIPTGEMIEDMAKERASHSRTQNEVATKQRLTSGQPCLSNGMFNGCKKGDKHGFGSGVFFQDYTSCQNACLTQAEQPKFKRFSFVHANGFCKCCPDLGLTPATYVVDYGTTVGDLDCIEADTGYLANYGTSIVHDALDINEDNAWPDRLTCLERCDNHPSCSCVVHSYWFQTCRIREVCQPGSFTTLDASTLYIKPTDELQELAYMTFQWSESKKHCTRTKMCELELVGPITTSNYLTVAPGMTYTHNEFCECVGAWERDLDTGDLDCTPFDVCIESHRDMVFMEILVLAHEANKAAAAGAAAAASLLQQISGHHDPATCRLPTPGCLLPEDDSDCGDPFAVPDCDCYGHLTSHCTSQNQGPLSDDDLYDCKRLHMCRNEGVCCSWKWNPTANGNTGQCLGQGDMDTTSATKCGGPSSLGQIHDTGNADKATAAPIAGMMHGRRQPPGINSSAVPMASLEESVSGKACTRSA